MFSKYLDQITAIKARLLELYQNLRDRKEDIFYRIELALIVEDFNNLNVLLNDDLKLYDQVIPFLDLPLLRNYVITDQVEKADALTDQWYKFTYDLMEYYRELDASRAVLYLEKCLTVFHYTREMLSMIQEYIKTLKQAA